MGDTLPSFELIDAHGSAVDLDQVVAGGPAVIVFYRGGWCPYCNVALRTYQQELVPQSVPTRPVWWPSARRPPTSPSRRRRKQISSSPSCPTRPIGSLTASA